MSKTKPNEILLTKDGSTTIYSPHFDEIYHSRHGAIQESQHVFIKMGLNYVSAEKDQFSILEVGFGTGLNAFLSFLANAHLAKKITYVGVEAFPLSEDILEGLNFTEQMDISDTVSIFRKIHTVREEDVKLSEDFSLSLHHKKIREFDSDLKFDLVYFDAFAPSKQPEMWTEEVFSHIYGLMLNNGILVTYCAKGDVRRCLESVGFQVDRIDGPPGKREMIRAKKL